jgi:mannosyltransferase OCH1-like enzyme
MARSVAELRDRLFFRRSDFPSGFDTQATEADRWAVLADRFDGNEAACRPWVARIPRIIHQVWVGGRLPPAYRRWTDSWRLLNPSWEYRLWDEQSIKTFGLRNAEAFRRSASKGVKSDIARYEILQRLGGIYADTDFECLAPAETMARGASFFCGLLFAQAPVISNGLLGFAPGHPLLEKVIEGLGEPVRTKDGMQILERTGPGYLTRLVWENWSLLSSDDVIYPSSYLFPVPNFIDKSTVTEARRRGMVRPWTFAIHYWETAWLTPSPQRRLLSSGKRLAKNALGVGKARGR